MFFSNKFKLLFIASPKTGSTSVEEYLSELDPHGEKHSITLDGKKYTSKDLHYGIAGHARAWEFKKAIGTERYDDLKVFGFVRHPFDKLISSYYFNRRIKLLDAFKISARRRMVKRMFLTFFSRMSARLLPLNMWALIFPMKTNFEYFHDVNDNRIVTYIGRTDKLESDLNIILTAFGLSTSTQVPHVNRSQHKNREDYFKLKIIHNYLAKKYKRDIDFYHKIETEMEELIMKTKEHNLEL